MDWSEGVDSFPVTAALTVAQLQMQIRHVNVTVNISKVRCDSLENVIYTHSGCDIIGN